MLNFLLFFNLPVYQTKAQNTSKKSFGVIPNNPTQASSMQLEAMGNACA